MLPIGKRVILEDINEEASHREWTSNCKLSLVNPINLLMEESKGETLLKNQEVSSQDGTINRQHNVIT